MTLPCLSLGLASLLESDRVQSWTYSKKRKRIFLKKKRQSGAELKEAKMCSSVEGTSKSSLATDVQGSKSVIEMPAAMVLSSHYRSLLRLWTSVKCHFNPAWFIPTTIPCFWDCSQRWGVKWGWVGGTTTKNWEDKEQKETETDSEEAVIGFQLCTVDFHHMDLVAHLIRSIGENYFAYLDFGHHIKTCRLVTF